ncbi:MAG: hypothetical protein IPN53_26260 [Comamonadaceae bacterium]|nr:hypothetical protein [Comamonadaceae bacterium]
MATLEKRLDALEQAARLSAAQKKPEIAPGNIEALRKKFDEILSREEGPELTQAEQIQKFKDDIARMNRNWELRYGSR